MQRYLTYLFDLKEDIKGFIYIWLMLTIFRIVFMLCFFSELENLEFNQIIYCLWLGMCLSLKTAGVIMLFSEVFGAIVHILIKKWPAAIIRRSIYSLGIFIYTLLFCIRIPYYQVFASNYNMMLINGMKDDLWATFITSVETYGLLWRLPIALIVAAILIILAMKLLSNKNGELNFYKKIKIKQSKFNITILSIITFFVVSAGSVFIRFGGAFTYAGSIHWENSAQLKSTFLNETILDDIQALYRVRSIYKRMKNEQKINFSEIELRNKIKDVGGNPSAPTIDKAFIKTVENQRLVKQPKKVVFILGETYALWPFLNAFDEPGQFLVEQTREILKSDEAMQTKLMLAHGSGTMPAVDGFITGLVDLSAYPNYEAESFKEKYATGIGTIAKKLGYKTVFWYGGFGSWQNIASFVLAQNFDEFHSAAEWNYTGGNAWGAPDGVLFNEIEKYMDKHPNEKTFHFILTSSNHPPYTIDLNKAGFNADRIKGKLPNSISKDEKTITELGHIWYADHVMGNFIKTTKKKFPDSIYVITGDHGERFTFAKDVGVNAKSAIPCIFYGKGVKKAWLGNNKCGAATQINATIAELLGNKGMTYSSVEPSLFSEYNYIFNHRLYIENGVIREQNDDMPKQFKDYIRRMRQISSWRIQKGNKI